MELRDLILDPCAILCLDWFGSLHYAMHPTYSTELATYVKDTSHSYVVKALGDLKEVDLIYPALL